MQQGEEMPALAEFGLHDRGEGRWVLADERVHCEVDTTARAAQALVRSDLEGSEARLSALDMVLRNVVIWAHLLGGGLALHASAVALRGRAWVFVGPTGAGKTTAARLACEDAGAEPLADDLVLLWAEADGARLLPTPDWQRPERAGPRPCGPVPVGGVFTLEKGLRARTQVLGPGASLAALTMRPVLAVVSTDAILGAAARILGALPHGAVRRLTFSLDASALTRVLCGSACKGG